MKETKIIGRIEEIRRLNNCMQESQAQLIIVYGRRRVGKTFLVNQFFDNRFTFKITGAYGQTRRNQLRNFASELKQKTGKTQRIPGDWVEAFEFLRNYLESLPSDEKRIVFFDEMPWLDTQRSGFLAAFEYFWNGWGSAQNHLVFIVCGSATSWIVDKLANNKGGLFNRHTCRMYLEPFRLNDVEAFLEAKEINWSRYEIAEGYMIMGGIPYYWNLMDRDLSYSQNIDNLFFRENGELWDEFDHLYKTLFTNSEQCIKVVEALSEKRRGLTRNEIIEKINVPANGVLTTILNNLVNSGFVRISGFYNQKKKDSLYQLADFYTAFYFRYIKDHYGKDEHFWCNSIDNPARRAWTGLTFEQLCKDHIPQIKHKLGISGVLSEESVWYTSGNEEDGIPGTQIDLIIERRDRVINLCEMKFSVNEFIIDKEYDMSLRNKVETFRRANNCKKSLQVTMITTYGVKRNKYSGFVGSHVILDDLFHA